MEIKNGIVVDDHLKTRSEGVFAAGDVAEHQSRVYGIWPAAQRQGETAGMNMAGGNALYQGTVVSNTLKVVGINLTAAGEIDPEGKLECIVRSDREQCTLLQSRFQGRSNRWVYLCWETSREACRNHERHRKKKTNVKGV